MNYRKLLKSLPVFIVMFIIFNINLNSQTINKQFQNKKLKHIPLHYVFGIGFANSVPQDQLMDNLQTSGQGFTFYGGYDTSPIPFTVGIEGSFLFFGGDTKYFDYGPGNWNLYTDTVTTQTTLIPLTLFFRIRPEIMKMFYPYIEFSVGTTMLSVSADYNAAGGATDSKDRFNATFQYGYAGGIMIKLLDFDDAPGSYAQMLLDIKMIMIKGSNSDFATVKILDDSSAQFDEFRTKTNMVIFSMGLVFRF